MRLRAKVTTATGNARHYIGTIVDDLPVPVSQLPVPDFVEIVAEDGAFYLYHFDADGSCFADTWHQTLEQAKNQATFEFRIRSDEWTEVDDNGDHGSASKD